MLLAWSTVSTEGTRATCMPGQAPGQDIVMISGLRRRPESTFKGGQSIEPHVINFCRTLGASRSNLLWSVRIPFVSGWMFAALPNAVAFSLIGVVISEFVGSDRGMGYLIITSLSTLNATDMFATITVLSVLGIVLVSAIRHVEQRTMKWSPEFRDAHRSVHRSEAFHTRRDEVWIRLDLFF